jgi:hypothetical protein
MLAFADVFIIYLYKINNKADSASRAEEGKEEEGTISRNKFIGLSLFLIAYFLALIFSKILKTGKVFTTDSFKTSFNFGNDETKIQYAKAKFILSVGVALLYFILSPILGFGSSVPDATTHKHVP